MVNDVKEPMSDGKMLKRIAEDTEFDPIFLFQNLISKSFIILRKINYEFQKNMFLEIERKIYRVFRQTLVYFPSERRRF
jgi:hypothetical protein